jgi:hypothetical protein
MKPLRAFAGRFKKTPNVVAAILFRNPLPNLHLKTEQYFANVVKRANKTPVARQNRSRLRRPTFSNFDRDFAQGGSNGQDLQLSLSPSQLFARKRDNKRLAVFLSSLRAETFEKSRRFSPSSIRFGLRR